MKYEFDMDFRHALFGMVLLFCLAVVTIFASIGVTSAEEKIPDAMDYDLIWIFMNIWSVLGVLVMPFYIIFFTKFNNPFKRKEDKK